MRSGQFIWIGTLAVILGACSVIGGGGPNDNRAERFDFTPVPVATAEAEAIFFDHFGPDQTVVPGSFVALGKIRGIGGDRVFAKFTLVDAQAGATECVGNMGPTGGGWSCGQGGGPVAPPQTFELGGQGSSDTWNEAEFRVGSDVVSISVTARDGTTYRVTPVNGFAWMEWKASHGDLVATAFNVAGAEISSISIDSDLP